MLYTHGAMAFDAGTHAGHELEEHDQILINTNGDLIVLVAAFVQDFPFVAVLWRSIFLLVTDPQGGSLINKTFHALVSHLDAALQLGSTDLEGGIGTVEQDFHDAGVSAGVDG